MSSEQPSSRDSSENKSEQGVIGPEGFLLAAVFSEEARPIPPEFESARRETIQKLLQTLPRKERGALDLRFGLSDGQPRTLKEVGDGLGVRFSWGPYCRQRAHQLVGEALRKFRYPSKSIYLELFLPLSEESLGKIVWGVQYGYELLRRFPQIINIEGLHLEELNLSETTLRELKDKGFSSDSRLIGILKGPAVGLSDQTCLELKQALERLAEE